MNSISQLVADEVGAAGGGDIMRLAPSGKATGDLSGGQREHVEAVGSLSGNEDGSPGALEAKVTGSAGQDNPSSDLASGEVEEDDSIRFPHAYCEHSGGRVGDQSLGRGASRKRYLRSGRGFGKRGRNGGLRHVIVGPSYRRAAARHYEEHAGKDDTCNAGWHLGHSRAMGITLRSRNGDIFLKSDRFNGQIGDQLGIMNRCSLPRQ
jgi:hypothetical protein